MSELSVRQYLHNDGYGLTWGYDKREADKVIADLEESHKKEVGQLLMEIAELKNKINEVRTELELWRDGSIISESHQKELDGKRNSDYKRCVAMAMCCAAERDIFNLTPKVTKVEFFARWHKRWLEIATKFKEAK
jgi:hypothetical protein